MDATSDNIGTNFLKVINSVSFSDLAIYTVELPVSEHGRPEVKEAKTTEVNNLLDYDVFEEVKDESQHTIQSRWVVTYKEKHERNTLLAIAKPASKSLMCEVSFPFG